MTIVGGILLLITLVDWFSNYSPIWEIAELTFGSGTPEPIIFGVIALILGIVLIRSGDEAVGFFSVAALIVGVFDLLLTTLFFVKSHYYGIDVPLTQFTKTLLWVGAFLIMSGGIEAMLIDSEKRKNLVLASLCVVIPLVVLWFALISLYMVV